MNEHIYDDEIRNIIYIGKTLERPDLYMRMRYPFPTVEKEFVRLCKNLHGVPHGTPFRYNTKYLSVLVETLGTAEDHMNDAAKALSSETASFLRPRRKSLIASRSSMLLAQLFLIGY